MKSREIRGMSIGRKSLATLALHSHWQKKPLLPSIFLFIQVNEIYSLRPTEWLRSCRQSVMVGNNLCQRNLWFASIRRPYPKIYYDLQKSGYEKKSYQTGKSDFSSKLWQRWNLQFYIRPASLGKYDFSLFSTLFSSSQGVWSLKL